MTHLEEMKHELMCCTGCGYCKQHCQTLDIGGTEMDSGRGRVFLSYGLLTGEITEDRSVVEALQRCPLCGRCEQDCPSNIPIRDIIQAARRDLHTLLPAHEELVNHIQQQGNPWGHQATATSTGTGPVGFYAGCISTHRAPELKEAALSVMEKLGITPVMVDEVCCGHPLEQVGQKNEQPQLLAQRFAAAGVHTVLTTCPGGAQTLQNMGNHFTVQHLATYLAAQQLKLQQLDTQLIYHDSSVLGRRLGIYDPPRQLLQKVGVFMEFKHKKALAECCGGDLAFRAAFPDMAAEMAQQLMREAEKKKAIVVTADPHCYLHLKEHGEVLDIVQVVDRCLQ